MNWALPLLFILLSPGFLLSLGSKCKISIMTILIHALIFAIIINVYGPELEGFQSFSSSSSGTIQVAPPPTLNEDTARMMVLAMGPADIRDLVLSIPTVANSFYADNIARNPSMASNVKLLQDDPSKPSPSGSGPTQYQKNTFILSYILPAFYQNNLKDICVMKSPTGTSMPWVPAPPLCPTPPACPECKPTSSNPPSFACTIM
jgi:hypothetical protein